MKVRATFLLVAFATLACSGVLAATVRAGDSHDSYRDGHTPQKHQGNSHHRSEHHRSEHKKYRHDGQKYQSRGPKPQYHGAKRDDAYWRKFDAWLKSNDFNHAEDSRGSPWGEGWRNHDQSGTGGWRRGGNGGRGGRGGRGRHGSRGNGGSGGGHGHGGTGGNTGGIGGFPSPSPLS